MVSRLLIGYVVFMILLLSGCNGGSNPADGSALDPVFGDPEGLTILNLPNGSSDTTLSVEEPFISRDSRFLFFNSGTTEGAKDLHYAEWVIDTWVYRDELGPGINTENEVQGNPTMDSNNRFYWIESSTDSMARSGIFDPDTGLISGLSEFSGIPDRDIDSINSRLTGNMGVEVSADGSFMFFSRATWTLVNFQVESIIGSDLLVTFWDGNQFVYDDTEAQRLMANINSDDLEYAASISGDGLELFFTRLFADSFTNGPVRTAIMRAERTSLSEPFGEPEMVESIGDTDFVEGPTLSSDESCLYYHKLEGSKMKIYSVCR